MRTKMATVVALVMVLGMLFSACQTAPQSNAPDPAAPAEATAAPSTREPAEQGKTKLTMITAGGGFWETPMAEVEKAYEDSHPDVDLNIEIYGYEQLFQVIESKIAGGTDEYDVIAVDAPLVAAYTYRGYLKPLDAYFTKDEQALYIDSSLKASIWDGKFMAAPLETSASLVFYNKTLLKEAGIDFNPEDPFYKPTWEQIADMSKQFVQTSDPDGSKGYFGFSFEQVSRPYTMLALANSLGEKGVADDGFTVDGVLNTPGWVKAMTYYGDMFKDGVSLRGIKSEEFSPLFFAGKALFHWGGPWNWYTCQATTNYEFGMMLTPAFEGYEDKAATNTGSWHLGINANSKNEELAAEFIKWISIGEGNQVWINASRDVPALKSSLDALVNNPDTDTVYKLCVYDALNTGYPRPVTPGYSEFETVTSAAFEDIRNGTDPQEALDSAVAQINTLFKKYK